MIDKSLRRKVSGLCAHSPARRAVLGILKTYRDGRHGPLAEAYLVRSFRACHRFPESTTRSAVALLVAVGAVSECGWAATRAGGRTKLLRAREGV